MIVREMMIAYKIPYWSLYYLLPFSSFSAIESGKPIHVPRVNNHGNIMFWRPDKPDEETDGSVIVVPLKDHRKRVFGLLGIDTLTDPKPRSIFITHEIQFFQVNFVLARVSYIPFQVIHRVILGSQSNDIHWES